MIVRRDGPEKVLVKNNYFCKKKKNPSALKKHSHFLLRNGRTNGQFKGPYTPGPCKV